jgi:chromate transporter
MMLGYVRAGWSGLLVAGTCFIIPAMGLVLALAWAYVRYGSLPQTAGLLYGVKPVIVAVVLDALWQLGRRALRSWTMAVVAAAVFGLYLVGANIVVLLFGGALLVVLAREASRNDGTNLLFAFIPFGAVTQLAENRSLLTVFLTFLKTGAVVYGSGYVLLAFLRADLVEHLHWLTQGQLVDAVAVGQITPGPVFTTATFTGYLVKGLPGAVVATAAIFLPAFVLSGVVYRFLPAIRRSPRASAFLDGVTVCGLGLMAGVTAQLARVSVVDAFTAVLAGAAFLVLRRYQPNSAWLVLAGALLGVLAHGLG